jgi:hypothetical protein
MTTHSECTICLLEYKEETKTETKCHHIFHQECLDRWLETNNSCPLCRHVLQEHTRSNADEEDPEQHQPSGSYNYSRMEAMQTIVTWRRHNPL